MLLLLPWWSSCPWQDNTEPNVKSSAGFGFAPAKGIAKLLLAWGFVARVSLVQDELAGKHDLGVSVFGVPPQNHDVAFGFSLNTNQKGDSPNTHTHHTIHPFFAKPSHQFSERLKAWVSEHVRVQNGPCATSEAICSDTCFFCLGWTLKL